MPTKRYIKAILPLRLEWEPCYLADPTAFPGLKVGDRVVVPLAGRKYHAVVSETDATPDIDPSRIQAVSSMDQGLEGITAGEIHFWRLLSEYYLTPIGEIYKIAYPSTLIDSEKKTARKRHPAEEDGRRSPLTAAQKQQIREILEWQGQRKSVLLRTDTPLPVYTELAKRATGSVLILTPEIDEGVEERLRATFGGQFVCFSKELSTVGRRNLASDLRAEKKRVIYGTRLALFLPFTDLSLVITDHEEDPRHKQDTREPRIHTRDAAAFLASIHNAQFIASSSDPSLESIYNASTGRYAYVRGESRPGGSYTVINTTEEKPKRGMCGSYSRKLLERVQKCIERKEPMLFLVPWKDFSELETEARELFAQRGWDKPRLKFANPYKIQSTDLRKYSLVAILHAEYLSSKEDFRGDEKASRLLRNIASRCADGVLVLQSTVSQGGFFRSAEEILAERGSFAFPPYTRMVDILFSDKNPERMLSRREELTRRIAQHTGTNVLSAADRIRVILPKDKTLPSRKENLRLTVQNFCTQRRYERHIALDVDPL